MRFCRVSFDPWLRALAGAACQRLNIPRIFTGNANRKANQNTCPNGNRNQDCYFDTDSHASSDRHHDENGSRADAHRDPTIRAVENYRQPKCGNYFAGTTERQLRIRADGEDNGSSQLRAFPGENFHRLLE